MKEVEVKTYVPNERRLLHIINGDVGSYFVAISHRELDGLVGRLLFLCDIIGGSQGEALKSEIKTRCRDWLDDHYSMAGYDKWSGVTESANPVEIK